MARDLLSPVGILDATHGAVARVASPWLGALWLLSAPYRLAQIYFIRELIGLGVKAGEYGGYLETLAWAQFVLFLPAVLGRAIYVRACMLGVQSGARVGLEALRVPPAQLINTLYGALLFEVLFCATAWMFFTVPILAVPAGLAYVAATRTDRPGLLKPLFEIFRLMSGLKVMVTLLATFTVALLAVYVNVFMAMRGALWAATALGSDGLPRWEHLLRPIHPRFPLLPGELLTALICGAAALLIVEPFWLAALTVYNQSTRLRQSGEDLRLRFRLLTGSK
jgi:hypothetical protein